MCDYMNTARDEYDYTNNDFTFRWERQLKEVLGKDLNLQSMFLFYEVFSDILFLIVLTFFIILLIFLLLLSTFPFI